MVDLSCEPARTYTKAQQLSSKRTRPTQRQLGAISPKVRQEVRERSGGRCEVLVRCKGNRATQQAHKRGRRIITHRTTAADLWDSCDACHAWLDSTGDGAVYKRRAREQA